MQLNAHLLEQVIDIVKQTGERILTIYDQQAPVDITVKADQSPLTEADIAANHHLLTELVKITPHLPVLSEESDIPDYSVRQQWSRYWLVDPLDGTKEFISKNGEFTVNVALIDQGVPVLGVVYQPVVGKVFAGMSGHGAHCYSGGERQAITARSMQEQVDQGLPVKIVTSRRHGLGKLEGFLAKAAGAFSIESTAIGSSLKLCLVAAGEADLYPRFGPTSEWDTAAAQAVVEAAGGHVLDLSWQPLRYNQKDEILNPEFIVTGSDPQRVQHYFSE